MIERVGELPSNFEIVLFPEPMPDPIGNPDGAHAVLAPYLEAGATTLNLRLRSDSLAQCLEQLEAVTSLVR